MSNSRIWLFRLLVVVAAGVMLFSWFQPWWTIDIEQFGNDIVQIRPWGLEISDRMGDFAVLLKGAPMPPWFAPAMWAYLGVCVIALLVGLFVSGKDIRLGSFKFSLSQLLIGGVGFSYFVAGIVTAVYASFRLKAAFDVPLQGRTFIDLGDPIVTFVDTRLLPGYYVIYAAALLLLALAFFHDKITGRPEAEA